MILGKSAVADNLRRITAVVFLLLFSSGHAWSDAGTSSYEGARTLGASELSILRDPARALSINDVSSPAFQNRFVPAVDGLKLGYSRDAIWIRVRLQRESSPAKDWLIRFNTSYVDDFRFYHPTEIGFRESQAGDRFAYAMRDYPHRTPVFPLAFDDDQVKTFYIRMTSDSTMTGSLLVYTQKEFLQAVQKENLLIGALLAMALLTTLVNLNTFLWSHNRQFLGFSALGFFLVAGSMAQLGLWSQMFFQRTPWIGDTLVPWTVGIFVFSVIWVFRQPLATRRQYPRLDVLLRFIAIMALFAPISRYFDVYAIIGGPFLMVSLIAGVWLISWVAFKNLRNGMEGAGYFLLGFVIYSASYLVAPLIALGWIAPIKFYEYVWIAGTVGFLFLAYQGAISEVRAAFAGRREYEARTKSALQLAKQEQSLRKEQTLFFAGVAHDLRTPLAAISMGLTNLTRELGLVPSSVNDRISRLRATSKRMADMIERHLQFQRLTHADFQLNTGSANPRDIVINAVSVVEEVWPRRRFLQRIDPALPDTVTLDSELIELALVNLLSNAAKYSPENSAVEISVSSSQNQIVFRVSDFGSGIPPDEVSRVFEIYWRAAQKSADVRPGTEGFGIGLATVRRIAELHGGQIRYQRAQRDGLELSDFSLEIPR